MTDRPVPRRPIGRAGIALLVCLTILGWLPILLAVGAGVVADAMGCTLNEAAVHPCIVAGRDVGELLATMFLLGWAAIFTFPIVVGTAIGWLVVWRRRRAVTGS